MSEDQTGVRWLMSGRVQGVGYRWFVLRRADELGIAGWVRNLTDGRVEVVGEGESQAMRAFEIALTSGPRFAKVDHVEKADFPHDIDHPNSFNIK